MNLHKSVLTLVAALVTGLSSAAIETKTLRCEYLVNPLGIDAESPRLSWILSSDERGEKQTAYQILVASTETLLKGDVGDLWDTGKIASDENSQIVYQGKQLASRQGCFWKVRAWDVRGNAGPWSASARWEMGLLRTNDWSAKWIASNPPILKSPQPLVIRRAVYEAVSKPVSADVTAIVAGRVRENYLNILVNNKAMGGDPAPNAVKHLQLEYEYGGKTFNKDVDEDQTLVLPEENAALQYMRKSFKLNSPTQRAILYTTALGLYDVHINGAAVGDHVLAPDWTDYRKRVRYQAYDVTKLLKSGDNAISVLLANGWYSGHIGNGGHEYFGTNPAFLAQLEVTGANGQTQQIVTDGTWKSHLSPVLSSDFMLGENYDSRLEIKGWDQPGLDETSWAAVATRNESARKLEAQVMEPVRKITELSPKALAEPRPGCWIYDLGQNMVGVVRLKLSAPAGTKVTLRHAEILNPDGTLYTNNLRTAHSVDSYVCKGGDVEIWQPRFTFHGFRYVELTGLTNRPADGTITGVVIASDTERTGEFACSDLRLNQLQSNIQWGQRGNYISVPTDCPQRDERLGWMGDAQVFIRTATYNADVAAFFTKWLVDVDDGQSPQGAFSDVNPNTMGGAGVPAWADAGVICPWTIYEAYGDKRILERHLPAMIKWVDYVKSQCHDLIRDKNRGGDYGDWLSIGANTPKDLIGTAYFAYSTHLLAKSCRVLGRMEEAEKYDRLFEDIKIAFNKRYVAADGRIRGDTQCVYAMALKFELLPDALRPKAADYLVEDINAKGGHLSTGFVGVSYLLPVLTQSGHADTAYRLLLQDTFPSWLFSVKQGATTIWERWDGWTPEKGFQDPGMNSFNHYSLGSCGEYLFGGIGGIRSASPGFKTIVIEPAIENGLTWADTRFDSIQGRIATSWKLSGGQLALDVVIPANTTATVCIPTKDAANITESGNSIAQAKGVKFLRQEQERATFEVGSGTYKFASAVGQQ